MRMAGGPIPAGAGEPVMGDLLAAFNRAYPRRRGGTTLPVV